MKGSRTRPEDFAYTSDVSGNSCWAPPNNLGGKYGRCFFLLDLSHQCSCCFIGLQLTIVMGVLEYLIIFVTMYFFDKRNINTNLNWYYLSFDRYDFNLIVNKVWRIFVSITPPQFTLMHDLVIYFKGQLSTYQPQFLRFYVSISRVAGYLLIILFFAAFFFT